MPDHVIRFDHARELEREQIRLAKRIAELEFEMEQRIGDLELANRPGCH